MNNKNNVCPVERAGSLDNKLRSFLQNPVKLLKPFVVSGMTVLDIGCGPGFFSIAIAELVGSSGKVFAADIQEGMLLKLQKKIINTDLESRIILHRVSVSEIRVPEKVDFILAFYMVHEVPDKLKFFSELKSILKPSGSFLIVEPKYFHVSEKDFNNMINIAENEGFASEKTSKFFMSQSVLLKVK